MKKQGFEFQITAGDMFLTVRGLATIVIDPDSGADIDGKRGRYAEFVDDVEIEQVLDGTADITKNISTELAEWIQEVALESATDNLKLLNN